MQTGKESSIQSGVSQCCNCTEHHKIRPCFCFRSDGICSFTPKDSLKHFYSSICNLSSVQHQPVPIRWLPCRKGSRKAGSGSWGWCPSVPSGMITIMSSVFSHGATNGKGSQKFLKSQVVFHNKRSREGTVLVLFCCCSLETHWLNQRDGKIATAISNKNNQPQ